jgi:hypothetical protein
MEKDKIKKRLDAIEGELKTLLPYIEKAKALEHEQSILLGLLMYLENTDEDGFKPIQ